jgi:hypothetical protein
MLINYKIFHEISEIPHGICLDSDNGDKWRVRRGVNQALRFRLNRLANVRFDNKFSNQWQSLAIKNCAVVDRISCRLAVIEGIVMVGLLRP